MTTFALPDLGEGLQDAELVAWHVAAGDHVVADQPLASVETEKAVVEIPSPHAGRIARLCAAPGQRVKVGAALVEFDSVAHADEGTVVGHLPEAPVTPPPPPATPSAPSRVAASPAVRALARRLDVALDGIAGTGTGGTITAADVEAAATSAVAAPAAAAPLSALRRTMADNMARAHAAVVPATVTEDADVGAWPPDADVTARLARAIAAAAAAEPALNAWYDHEARTLRRHRQVDLGVAVDTGAGLIVPVLRDVAAGPADALGAELRRLAAAARERKLQPAELRGATFTLSNFGTLAGRYAQLVVVPPQVAILGAGRIRDEAVVVDGTVRAGRRMPLSLTFDHRAVTGGEAARFLAALLVALRTVA